MQQAEWRTVSNTLNIFIFYFCIGGFVVSSDNICIVQQCYSVCCIIQKEPSISNFSKNQILLITIIRTNVLIILKYENTFFNCICMLTMNFSFSNKYYSVLINYFVKKKSSYFKFTMEIFVSMISQNQCKTLSFLRRTHYLRITLMLCGKRRELEKIPSFMASYISSLSSLQCFRFLC